MREGGGRERFEGWMRGINLSGQAHLSKGCN